MSPADPHTSHWRMKVEGGRMTLKWVQVFLGCYGAMSTCASQSPFWANDVKVECRLSEKHVFCLIISSRKSDHAQASKNAKGKKIFSALVLINFFAITTSYHLGVIMTVCPGKQKPLVMPWLVDSKIFENEMREMEKEERWCIDSNSGKNKKIVLVYEHIWMILRIMRFSLRITRDG